MAVLVLDEIDLRADSRIRQVSLGMSIRLRNSAWVIEQDKAFFVGRVTGKLQSANH